MASSSQASYPLTDARHPPPPSRHRDCSGGSPAPAPGAGSPWFPASGSALRLASAASPCPSRSGHQIGLSSAAHASAPDRTTSCLSAPATPRRSVRALNGPETTQHHHYHHHTLHHHDRRTRHLNHSRRSPVSVGMVAYRTHDNDRALALSASLPSVASLPSLPPFAQSKLTALPDVDMELDRLARACGQGPVHGLTVSPRSSDTALCESQLARGRGETSTSGPIPASDVADDLASIAPNAVSWSLRPRATSVRVPQRPSPAATPSRPRSTSQPASIPVFSPSSPRGVLRALREALDLEGMQLEDCLDVHQVFERWDRVHDRGPGPGGAVHHKTFGASVATAVKCASMSTVLGGFQHHVPWVVYACVEELNRTGIYQPGLFRAVPSRTRLARLIEAFDLQHPTSPTSDVDDLCPTMTPTPSTTRASLRKESMPDICALLKTYLDLLPEPLLDANIAHAVHKLCVQPSLERENDMDYDTSDSDGGYFATHSRSRSAPPASLRFPASTSHLAFALLTDVPMTPSEHRDAQLSLEAPQIRLTQRLLRLAPPPALALLAYLLGFFTQLPLCPDNGMDFDDVARMFGRVLVGGPRADVRTVRECTRWLLERWARVSDGLFDFASAPEEEGGLAPDGAPGFGAKASFAVPSYHESPPSPPPSSCESTPRQLFGPGEKADAAGIVRMQTPYDPGLLCEHAPRPHSTSVSSDGSSATSASFDTEDAHARAGGFSPFIAPLAKDAFEAESSPPLPEVREYEAPFDAFERGIRVPSGYGLVDREYVSCPPSPRAYCAHADLATLPSPPASVRSLEAECSWADFGCSGATSRCTSPPGTAASAELSPGEALDLAERGSFHALQVNDSTPRNSAAFET
ncbi:hypothetical protein BD413DRAFT_592635 [Trametes elegans]|nr:hypothetical protein BD413DRAFT_592635 [Trametes elegans]